MEFGSFPKALAYNIKALSGFSKQAVRLTPDKWDSIKPNDTIKVALPQNTLVDLRTFCMYYEAIGDTDCHMPRLSSSIVKTLSIYINGNLIERIQSYTTNYMIWTEEAQTKLLNVSLKMLTHQYFILLVLLKLLLKLAHLILLEIVPL